MTLLACRLKLQQQAGTEEAFVEHRQGPIRHSDKEVLGIEHFVLAIDPEYRITNQMSGKRRQDEEAHLRIA
jgi:hypothetical protein